MKALSSTILASTLLALLFLMIVPRPAYAYIDPGSGSIIWQLLLASLLSALVLFKVYWYKIRSLFTGRGQAEREDSDLDDR